MRPCPRTLLPSAAASLWAPAAIAQPPAHGAAMQHRHGDPQAYVASLEDPARAQYQKPEEMEAAGSPPAPGRIVR